MLTEEHLTEQEQMAVEDGITFTDLFRAIAFMDQHFAFHTEEFGAIRCEIEQGGHGVHWSARADQLHKLVNAENRRSRSQSFQKLMSTLKEEI